LKYHYRPQVCHSGLPAGRQACPVTSGNSPGRESFFVFRRIPDLSLRGFFYYGNITGKKRDEALS
jgi:hypothetical protein